MADMIIVYRVMPEDGEIEYSELEEVVKKAVSEYDSSVKVLETKAINVGFGLQAVSIKFQLDEKLGSEELENGLKELPEVGDVVLELMDRL
jgi:translation elongation factor EF-1beta